MKLHTGFQVLGEAQNVSVRNIICLYVLDHEYFGSKGISVTHKYKTAETNKVYVLQVMRHAETHCRVFLSLLPFHFFMYWYILIED